MAFASLSPPTTPVNYVDARRFCTADGVTDDRASIASALASVTSRGVTRLDLGTGTYRLSKYVDIAHKRGLHILGRNAKIILPSGDATVVPDATAASSSMARSALLLRYCSDILVEGVTFIGDTSTDIVIQLGSGVYATHSVGISLIDCNQINGASIVQQDATNATAGTGDTLTYSSGHVTITDASAAFVLGHGVGCRWITISGAMNPQNNGVFRITSYTSATTLVYENAAGVTEPTSNFKWTIDDNDRGLRVRGGRSFGARKNIIPTNDTVISEHTFEQPDTADVCGIGDALTLSGSTVTLTDQTRNITTKLLGKYVTITGASGANNGTFLITAAVAKSGNTPASLSWANASGVTELFGGSWWVANGEKTGIGGASGAFATDIASCTVDASSDTITRVDHGYQTGTNVRFTATSMPGGLGTGDFYVIPQTADTFKVASSASNAYLGTAVNITSNGTTVNVTAGTRLTVTASSFAENDFTKNIRILGATSSANNGLYTINMASGSTVVFNNWNGVSEPFSGAACQWTIDGYDRVGGTTTGNGSSHAIYIFAGRSDIKIIGCTFRNIRTIGVKVSGSSTPIDNVIVSNCYFKNCGAAATWGADDSCEHSNLTFTGNLLVDCTMNRTGWSEGATIGVLGSRSIKITNNTFYFTQNNIASLDGTGLGGVSVISLTRYQAGASQPIEGVEVSGNTFACDPQATTPTGLMTNAILATRVGQRSHYDTAGSLTKSGNVMTLTNNAALFSAQLVGRPIQFVNSTNAANNGTYTIESVPSGTTLTFTNAAGVAGALGGTYRIYPDRSLGAWSNSYHRGGILKIAGNTFDNVSMTTIATTGCISPEITDNTFAFGAISSTGDTMPVIRRNKCLASNTNAAEIQLASPIWPVIADNTAAPANQFASSIAARGDMSIGLNSTVTDFPLLGTHGRVRPSGAREEVVFAYGYDHVDGDTLEVGNTTYTYKATSPTGNQFNSLASLLAAINANTATTNISAADYGTGFSAGDIATTHVRVRRSAQSTTDGNTFVRSTALNGTALVILRNDQSGSSSKSASRGSGSAGPIDDKTVVWSAMASHAAVVSLTPDNDAARALLASGSAATGKITCVAKAFLFDADYLTIGDGLSAPKLYELDVTGDGVTAGRIQVNVSTDTTAATVAARLRTAILANQPALSVTDNADGTLTVAHLISGTVGNVTMTENVANAGFLVTGLANGGVGGFRQLRSAGTPPTDSGACAVMQHAKSSNQAGVDLGVEFRFEIGG